MEDVLIQSTVLDEGRRRTRVRYHADMGPGRKKPTASEMKTANEIFRVLKAHYPGHPWSIEVDEAGGWAKIGIIELLGPNWGMVVHLDTWTDHQVKDYAGQLLERFKIPRSTIDIAAYMSAERKIPLLGSFRAKDKHSIPV